MGVFISLNSLSKVMTGLVAQKKRTHESIQGYLRICLHFKVGHKVPSRQDCIHHTVSILIIKVHVAKSPQLEVWIHLKYFNSNIGFTGHRCVTTHLEYATSEGFNSCEMLTHSLMRS